MQMRRNIILVMSLLLLALDTIMIILQREERKFIKYEEPCLWLKLSNLVFGQFDSKICSSAGKILVGILRDF